MEGKLQFSASPNGKIREVSDAKKRALQVLRPVQACRVSHKTAAVLSRTIHDASQVVARPR